MERLFCFSKEEMRIIRRRRARENRKERCEAKKQERLSPKLFPDIQIPVIPFGMKAVRFHGSLAFIPERQEGEGLFQKSPFTESQAAAINELTSQVNNGRGIEAGGMFGGHD